MSKLRAGIIGCGGIALEKHIPALKSCGALCVLTAFCDPAPERAERARALGGAPGAKCYRDYHDLLADPEVDVVHICTPNAFHCDIAVAAFAAGKHVYVEKPMSHSAAEAERMVAAWKEAGTSFTVGNNARFRPEVRNLRSACLHGDLGEIYYARAAALRRRGVPTWGVFANKALQGGGPLIDIGVHSLDLALWCMDNFAPDSVSGAVFQKLGRLHGAEQGNLFGPWDPDTYEVEDSAFALLKMKNGAVVSLETAWAINLLDSREVSVTLAGTRGGGEIRAGISYPVRELVYNRARNGQLMQEALSPAGQVAYFAGDGGGTEGELDARQWLESIRKGTDPVVRPEQALAVTRILEAVYRAARENIEVRF